METDASQSHAGKKVSSYSTEYKVEAIKFAEENKSISSAAKKFNVDRKRIREWQSAKAKLQAADNKRKRLEGGGRKPFDVGLEDELLEWVHERRSSGLRVSRAMISHKARAIHEQKCKAGQVSPSFIASNGWVQKFMARNGLSVRRRTTESQKDPDRLIDKLIAYILQVRRQRNRHSYNHSDIIAMDETAVWQDMLSSTTVDNVGEKSIRLKTTGHEKSKVSVCLTAKADGTKLKPFIVFPGAKRETKQLNEEYKNKCYVASSVNGWMNEDLTREWVQRVLGKFSFARRMLAWDSFKCHITDSIKQELAHAKIDPVIVPGGCTKYIQAPDVAWNKPFKAKVTEKYDAWMADGAHSFTAAGNMRGPPRREIVKWVLEARETLGRELIIRSFRSCALTVAPDGSEDDQIHCLKEGQPCHAGQDRLASIQQALTASRATDPFADVTLSDVEEAAPERSLIELSDDDIEVD